eukprot:TRINITY_DN2163_c0_g1_i1.p1 TRINITY_DN2163_c0_g1~~TRINITY_DN2163_c0_g1_i1.p1  ORF type:complete len:629 (-),score=164.49 TRINITY_DN2163_c0_g1_i1:127-2013(-)
MKSLLFIVVGLIAIGLVKGAPVTFSIPSVIHDVFGCNPDEWMAPAPNGLQLNAANCSPDVQTWGGNDPTTGMVENKLDSKKKMVYTDAYWKTGGKNQQAQSAETFNWLWNQGQHTFDINYDFVLTNPNPESNDVYTYDNQAFFPIDGRGWGNTKAGDAPYHNFGFCMESHSVFTYRGGEVFNFTGDDDLWIFVDNRLAMDLGGLHPARYGNINLDTFGGLYKGATYNFDIFYCERHTFFSTIKVQTTIAIYCPPEQIDFCGVCQGTGECCKNPCVPQDKCHTVTRNAKTCECNQILDLNKKYTCDGLATKCETFSCNPSVGDCSIKTPIPDTNPTLNDSCHDSICDPSTGWRHPDKGYCNKVKCKLDNTCVPTPGPDPANPTVTKPYHCVYTNSCLTAYCDNNNVKCELSNSKCYDNICDDTAQGCVRVYKTKPDVTDACTNATCDDTTGIWSYIPKNCPSTNCSIGNCDTNTGECVPIPKPCDDLNNCTQNLCHPENGTCYYPPIDLIALQGSDTCLTVTCNPDFGGILYTRLGTDVACPNADRCKPDSTVPGCCVCKPVLSTAAIAGITTGAIVGAVVGGVAGAALLGVGGKVGYDYFAANSAAGSNVNNNPLYVETGTHNNPLAN